MRRLLVFALALAACTPTTPKLSIEVTPGYETDAFSRAPSVTSVVIRALDSTGASLAESSSKPGGAFSLGEFPLDQLVTLEAEGRDDAGDVRVRGRSMAVTLSELATDTLPLFVQRTDAFARPPGALALAHPNGAASAIGERFLLLTGGTGTDAAAATYYDLLSLGSAKGGVLPRVAETLVVVNDGSAVLVLGKPSGGGDVGASWVDFNAGTVTDVAAPTGLDSFAEVSGGAVVRGGNGESYVVGATRESALSDRILVVGKDRTLRALRGTAARRGAAAAWVPATGLVIAGGSATAAGVETLADGGTAFSARAYPPDATHGAAAIASGNDDEMLLLGGERDDIAAPSRLLTARCTANCTATELDGAGLGAARIGCTGYRTSPGVVLTVCLDPSTRETLVDRVTLATHDVVAVPLRERRTGATSLPTPLGGLAILGGVRISDGEPALHVESYLAP